VEVVRSGSGDGPIDDDDSEDDVPEEDPRYSSKLFHGLEFTYSPDLSTKFEEKRWEVDSDYSRLEETTTGHHGIVSLSM